MTDLSIFDENDDYVPLKSFAAVVPAAGLEDFELDISYRSDREKLDPAGRANPKLAGLISAIVSADGGSEFHVGSTPTCYQYDTSDTRFYIEPDDENGGYDVVRHHIMDGTLHTFVYEKELFALMLSEFGEDHHAKLMAKANEAAQSPKKNPWRVVDGPAEKAFVFAVGELGAAKTRTEKTANMADKLLSLASQDRDLTVILFANKQALVVAAHAHDGQLKSEFEFFLKETRDGSQFGKPEYRNPPKAILKPLKSETTAERA